jgi:UDP-galactopyranose mutase
MSLTAYAPIKLTALDESDASSSRADSFLHHDFDTVICFSHLRWDFVLQRPQHLMQRFAAKKRLFFFEEHIPCDHHLPYLEHHAFPDANVVALRPRLPHWWDAEARDKALAGLLDNLLKTIRAPQPLLWFYTPMMFGFARHVEAAGIVYDCMDELSNFRAAPPELRALEADLVTRADIVFTGGYSLYEAKRHLHDNIHPFPSAVDLNHFARARNPAAPDCPDQTAITRPRLGFYGVIDERLDLDLLRQVAQARPDWSLVIVGPVVKISPDDLPRLPNIHYLGGKKYAELPDYLGGWDVALMPFAINEATRFISPTKTPEYLAGGRPVVSTPIVDVIRHYGDIEAVVIAGTPEAFIAACEKFLGMSRQKRAAVQAEADRLLAEISWDRTFGAMSNLIDDAVAQRRARAQPAKANDARPKLVVRPAVRPSNPARHYDAVVVGAGFAGSVLAERLAAGSGKRVLVVDRRPHIAGNAYDHHDAAGILIHRYGPHIFHTKSQQIVDYLSRFTRWRPYEHRVLASVENKLLPIPINRTTLNGLYGLNLHTEEEAAAFLASRAEPIEVKQTSEDVVVSTVGRHLYETFFRGYTRKQWGLDPSELDKSVTSRIPTRTNTDDRYFLDDFQAMPCDGYTRMFENMLDHDDIDLQLGVSYQDIRKEIRTDHTVFTGPIDEYFDYRFGRLPYRSLDFRHETLDQRRFQPVAVVNYPDEQVPWTRITEYKHLTGQIHEKTSISYEFPSSEGDPYYPIPRPENQALYRQYAALAEQSKDVTFVGRLGTYQYYNMDQVVGQALAAYKRLAAREAAGPAKRPLPSVHAAAAALAAGPA